jgi:hypothetical protein
MMSPDVRTQSLTSIVAGVMSAVVPFTDSRQASRRRVVRWCRRQRFELLRWRVAKLFEGPSSWDPDERHYRIQIADTAGRRRAAYLTFGRPFVFERCTEVLWDDASGRSVPGSPDASLTEDDDTSGLVPAPSSLR